MKRILVFFVFLLALIVSANAKVIGDVKLIFTEDDLRDALQEIAPISIPNLKGLRGEIYIQSFDGVRIADDNRVSIDVTFKGENLKYVFSLAGKNIEMDIGTLIFYVRLKVDWQFKENRVFYQIKLEEQPNKDNPEYIGKFILPLLSAYFNLSDSSIGGSDILKPFRYKRKTDEMESTFIIRGVDVTNKVVTIRLGMDFVPR